MADGILGFLQNGMMSPLFQSGAAMYNAGAQGQNLGGGFMAGAEAANTASKNLYQQSQQQRQQAQQQQRDQMWQGIMSGKPPPWAANLPRGTLDLARALGPDAGTELIAGMMKSAIGQGHQQAQLAEQRRMHDASIANMEAQRRLQEQEVARRNATAEREQTMMDRILRGEDIAGPVPSPAPAVPPQVDPNIRPQSFQGAPAGVPGMVVNDPNFIRTQAADGEADPPAMTAPAAGGMIKTPYGEMTVDKARRMAGGMMMVPKLAAAGKALMDSIPQTRLGKEATNENDKGQLARISGLGRLREIEAQFDPKFLQFENRLGYAWTDFWAKFRSGEAMIKPEDEAELARFVQFRADATDNLIQYIKDITGAAMGVEEAKRIIASMPKAGESIWDGDSPPAFKAKLDAAIRRTKMAIARSNWLRDKGFSGDAEAAARAYPLDTIPQIYQRRAQEIEKQELQRNPGIKPEMLRPLVQQKTRREFGIDI